MDKLEIIKRNTIEIINEDQLTKILKKKSPIAYCGYEPSGEIHLGHLVTITKLMDLSKVGFHIKILFADWHAYLNQKGDWKFINEQIKIWKKGFIAAGLKKAEYVTGSSFQRTKEYIDDVLTIATKTTINRALRSMNQVARDIENAKVSQVIYPFMQIADIKHLNIDLVQAGIEQRKIHMLGCETLKDINYKTPVFLHTPLINSLKDPGSKMSSSDLGSFISIRDTDEDIKAKIKDAYCPAGISKDNPILEIAKLIVFPRVNKLAIKRDKKFGGDLAFENYNRLEDAFINKKLHPQDLKNSIADCLCKIIKPIRDSFKS